MKKKLIYQNPRLYNHFASAAACEDGSAASGGVNLVPPVFNSCVSGGGALTNDTWQDTFSVANCSNGQTNNTPLEIPTSQSQCSTGQDVNSYIGKTDACYSGGQPA